MNEPTQALRATQLVLGVVCGLIGLAFLLLVIFIIQANISATHVFLGTEFLVAIIAMGAAGAFISLISYRLLLDRGSRVGGGLFSPFGWRLLGSLFVVLTVVLIASTIWWQDWNQLVAPIFGGVFAMWCFSTAKKYSNSN